MILQALNAYYERLSSDPNSQVAPLGYSRQKISFCVVLNEDGTLHEIQNLVTTDGGKRVTSSMVVTGGAKPSGSGINPCFLWDNAAYMLAHRVDDPKPERTREAFEAFRKRHLDVEKDVDDGSFSAVCRFLETWDPVDAIKHPTLVELGSGFGVFRLRLSQEYIHERPAVARWWNSQLASEAEIGAAVSGQCLVTGNIGPLARLHEPKVKGVWGGQSSGGTLVSFNADAFESYGKSQSYNAPVGAEVAFRYCTALNSLLEDTARRFQVGDASTIFWTAVPTQAESVFGFVFEPTLAAEDEGLKLRLAGILKAISCGSYPPELGPSETPFYMLGLSPNAARISIRFWHESTLGDAVAHIGRHYSDLSIDHNDRDLEFPSLWMLLRETVRDSKDLPPLLAGSVMRAILTGRPYPRMLLSAVIRRIRADRHVRYLRAAILKACLNRNTRAGIDPLSQEIEMALNPDRPEPAYQFGRLFAELEKSQEDALPGVNATIKDRYFGSASATPASVFPRLIRMNQHHLNKLEKRNRTYRERRIQDIANRVDSFPPHLGLRDQGLFAIGYYHQRQDIFTKKVDVSTEE